jgi:hypothetical protein
MSNAEVILTIGSLVLLTLFSLSLNTSIVQDNVQMYQSAQVSEALVLAQRFVEAAETAQFDEDKTATIPSSFSTTLGPESGETFPNFDDVDDYNGLLITQNWGGSISFTVRIQIYYVTETSPFTKTTSKTYKKYMEVQVTSAQDANVNVKLERLFAYHYFFVE